ncbi:MAG: cation diffusion facilitator family transporter [Allosphingosinicella sp.]
MTDHERRSALTTRAAMASVTVATLLLVLKTYAAWATGSVAMLGSLADTTLDVIASLITLMGVRVAAMPADREHRFGHGKAEALAALVQAILISLSALAIAWRAVLRMIEGQRTSGATEGIIVSIVAILLTFVLIFYQRSVIRRTGSVAIGADAVHYQSDLLLNLAVIAALALEQYGGFVGADALFGLAIALWLIFAARRASVHAVDQLMDREWPDEKRARFIEVAARHPQGLGIHDLRTRSSGAHDFAQFHIWIDPKMTVAAAHEVVEDIEGDLEREFPGIEVLIHLDPEGHVDQPGNELVETDLTKEESSQ